MHGASDKKTPRRARSIDPAEAAVQALSNLRETPRVGAPLVFVTPNKVDYGKPPDGADDAAADLETVAGFYRSNRSNINWAMASIRSY